MKLAGKIMKIGKWQVLVTHFEMHLVLLKGFEVISIFGLTKKPLGTYYTVSFCPGFWKANPSMDPRKRSTVVCTNGCFRVCPTAILIADFKEAASN